MTINLGVCGFLSAFQEKNVVGSKVLSGEAELMKLTIEALQRTDKLTGIDTIELPSDAYHLVRNGSAPREGLKSKDFHNKLYRGRIHQFALPHCALPVTNLSVQVYGIEEYLAEDDVTRNEANAHKAEGSTHVITAVHAGHAELDPYRLAYNVSGGNQKFIPSTRLDETSCLICSVDGEETSRIPAGILAGDVLLLHKIVDLSKKATDYADRWVTIADPDEPEDDDS